MTEDNKINDPLAPIEKTSWECPICGKLKSSEGDARQCALDDTRNITVEKVLEIDSKGFPKRFKASFRIDGVEKMYAEVEPCITCGGKGEVDRNGGLFPCNDCRCGLVVRK